MRHNNIRDPRRDNEGEGATSSAPHPNNNNNSSSSTAVRTTATRGARIHRLTRDVINRIAAGEVVQRPSAALKELLENSLDAGSTLIHVTCRDGGLAGLQVRDDGCGVHPRDFPLLCERYATSKLEHFTDLEKIGTFGFRGEALASLSYVGRVTITSRQREDPPITTTGSTSTTTTFGWRGYFADGKLLPLSSSSSSAHFLSADVGAGGEGEGGGCSVLTEENMQFYLEACPTTPGTSIRVDHLFSRNPTRRAALKPNEEWSRLLDVVTRYALAFPRVGFSCWKEADGCGSNNSNKKSSSSSSRRSGGGAGGSTGISFPKDSTTLQNIRLAYGTSLASHLRLIYYVPRAAVVTPVKHTLSTTTTDNNNDTTTSGVKEEEEEKKWLMRLSPYLTPSSSCVDGNNNNNNEQHEKRQGSRMMMGCRLPAETQEDILKGFAKASRTLLQYRSYDNNNDNEEQEGKEGGGGGDGDAAAAAGLLLHHPFTFAGYTSDISLQNRQSNSSSLASSHFGLTGAGRSHLSLFINNRLVEHAGIRRLVEATYAPLFAANHNVGAKPFTVLFLAVPANRLDANIHPTKKEVSLLDEDFILQQLGRTLRQALVTSSQEQQLDMLKIHQQMSRSGGDGAGGGLRGVPEVAGTTATCTATCNNISSSSSAAANFARVYSKAGGAGVQVDPSTLVRAEAQRGALDHFFKRLPPPSPSLHNVDDDDDANDSDRHSHHHPPTTGVIHPHIHDNDTQKGEEVSGATMVKLEAENEQKDDEEGEGEGEGERGMQCTTTTSDGSLCLNNSSSSGSSSSHDISSSFGLGFLLNGKKGKHEDEDEEEDNGMRDFRAYQQASSQRAMGVGGGGGGAGPAASSFVAATTTTTPGGILSYPPQENQVGDAAATTIQHNNNNNNNNNEMDGPLNAAGMTMSTTTTTTGTNTFLAAPIIVKQEEREDKPPHQEGDDHHHHNEEGEEEKQQQQQRTVDATPTSSSLRLQEAVLLPSSSFSSSNGLRLLLSSSSSSPSTCRVLTSVQAIVRRLDRLTTPSALEFQEKMCWVGAVSSKTFLLQSGLHLLLVDARQMAKEFVFQSIFRRWVGLSAPRGRQYDLLMTASRSSAAAAVGGDDINADEDEEDRALFRDAQQQQRRRHGGGGGSGGRRSKQKRDVTEEALRREQLRRAFPLIPLPGLSFATPEEEEHLNRTSTCSTTMTTSTATTSSHSSTGWMATLRMSRSSSSLCMDEQPPLSANTTPTPTTPPTQTERPIRLNETSPLSITSLLYVALGRHLEALCGEAFVSDALIRLLVLLCVQEDEEEEKLKTERGRREGHLESLRCSVPSSSRRRRGVKMEEEDPLRLPLGVKREREGDGDVQTTTTTATDGLEGQLRSPPPPPPPQRQAEKPIVVPQTLAERHEIIFNAAPLAWTRLFDHTTTSRLVHNDQKEAEGEKEEDLSNFSPPVPKPATRQYVRRLARRLVRLRGMLEEYFGVEITADGCLLALPQDLGSVSVSSSDTNNSNNEVCFWPPDLQGAPLLLLRLAECVPFPRAEEADATTVEAEAEAARRRCEAEARCLAAIAKHIANSLYSRAVGEDEDEDGRLPPQHRSKEEKEDAGRSTTATNLLNPPVSTSSPHRCTPQQRDALQHGLFPCLKQKKLFSLPAACLVNGSIQHVVSVESLYKVFERC